VVLENCAVGEDYRHVSLRFDDGYEELASIDESRGDVRMVPLDALVSDFEFIKVLKLDTEGYDEKIIISSGDSLQKTCVVVSEMNTETLRSFLGGEGFRIEQFKPSGYPLGVNQRVT
jgi:hypothetical protein